ncbi:CHAT domain-containing protein [Microcoleus sp. w2-18bC1]|uniref:CHAT domain-containing protein n=1 Tax=unclassified Microcoleus TaxID=2642155 RepID=UPI002FCF0A46
MSGNILKVILFFAFIVFQCIPKSQRIVFLWRSLELFFLGMVFIVIGYWIFGSGPPTFSFLGFKFNWPSLWLNLFLISFFPTALLQIIIPFSSKLHLIFIKKKLKRLLTNLYILLFVSGCGIAYFILLLLSQPINNQDSVPNYKLNIGNTDLDWINDFLMGALQYLFHDFSLLNIFGVGIAFVFLWIPLISILLLIWSVFGLSLPIYFLIQKLYYSPSFIIATPTFVLLYIVKNFSLFTGAIFVSSIILVSFCSMILPFLNLGNSLKLNNIDFSVAGILLYILLIYGAFSYFVLIINIFLGIIFPFLISRLSNIIRNKQIKLSINKLGVQIIGFYFPYLTFSLNQLMPCSLFSPISSFINISVLESLLLQCTNNEFAPLSTEIRDFLVNLSQKILTKKHFFDTGFNHKKSLGRTAFKLFLAGNLKEADILYKNLWVFAQSPSSFTKSSNNLDDIFNSICYFYLETHQFKSLKKLLNEAYILVQKHNISVPIYLSNLMKISYANQKQSNVNIKDLIPISTLLNWKDIVSILLLLPDLSSKDSILNLQSPADMFKFFLNQTLVDVSSKEYRNKFLTENRHDLLRLLASLQLFFETQNKIYSFVYKQQPDCLPNLREIQAALAPSYLLKVLGLKIELKNLFLKDNEKLISLMAILDKNSLPPQIIENLIESATEQGRKTDVAFLQCCLGKFLINNGSVDQGLNTLQKGITLYEGIRHSISTDQLGVSFGSSYLQYYDWAIDALIQMGNYREAFDYTERATARAVLDLVSRKTFSSSSEENLSHFAKLLGEIRDVDFNIYFSQSVTYEIPFLVKFLPTVIKRQLEIGFYKEKEEKLKRLLKHKDSLLENLEALYPVSATLFKLKTLTWKNSSEPGESFTPFEALWSSGTISETEAILCFHVIHKLSFSKNKPWDKIVCFVLYRESDHLQLHHHVVDDPQTVSELQALCQGIGNDLKRKKPLKSLALISDNLTIPLLQHLPETYDSLTIAANSDLQFFPWSILYDQESMQLIERFCIRITPSLSLLYLLKQREDFRTKIPTKFLVAGVEQYPNPQEYLFWSGIEVNRISQLYDSPSVLKNADVDQHFANQFEQAEVIHYSGHGNYQESDSERDPLDKTYLCLYNKQISAAQILDGALENPTAKVMILSACLTGRGDLTTSGSEILGLERALFHAGLSSLITTLWSVDEFATALLMLKLHLVWHQHNNTLETLASSLREAQLWLNNLSWRQLKEEFPEINQDVSNCLAAYQTLIIRAHQNQDESTAKRFEKHTKHYEKIANLLLSESHDKSFRHPYFWAAFQIKGMG